MASEVYRDVDGYYVSRFFHEENIRSAMNYKPGPGDVMVMGYPKSGTTWLQQIVHRIFSGGAPAEDSVEIVARGAILEFLGEETVRALPKVGGIRTHMPFDMAPFSNEAKYVFICRNPYDVCVSFFHHTKKIPIYKFENGTFNEFLRYFIDGKVDTGDYFDHLMSYYKRRHEQNVFSLTYEDLKGDPRHWVLKMADFLGEQHGRRLREDEEKLENILKAISFEEMQKTAREEHKIRLVDRVKSLPGHLAPKALPRWTEESDGKPRKPMKGDFIRSGVVGDWKKYFSADHIAMMKQRIAERTRGTDLMDLWSNCDLP